MSEIIYADKNVALTFYVPLTTFSGATLQGLEDGPTIQVNPTLASGDAKHSGDGGAFANLGTLPVVTPASGRAVKIVLSQAEMNYDCVFIQLVDQTNPKEWADKVYTILTKPLAVNVTQNAGTAITSASGIQEVKVASIAANAITATAINADAFTAAKFASDVTTEFQSGLATAANLATVAGYLDTEIAAILADTNELQTDWVNGGRLDLIIDAINAKTTNLPSDPADASVIAGRFDTLDTSVADLPTNAELTTALGTADDAVLTQIALVKAKTDSLTFTVAGVLDANMQYVNDVELAGTGIETTDEWRPA